MDENLKNFIEFSKPFISAAKNVFETMVFTKLEPGKPQIKKGKKSRGDVSAVLGLSGEVKKKNGTVPYKAMLVLSWPYATYFKVASAMLMEEFTAYSEENADVGGEIVNMIMGNAKRDLGSMDYTSNMAIPSMIEGPGHSINYPAGTTIVMIPITSTHGEMFMELCYAEGSAES
jgi:chemotaxis protein CheX